MTEFEKMLRGEPFDDMDPAICAIRDTAAKTLLTLNNTIESNMRLDLLQQLMGSFAPTSIIRSPFYCEFGKTISIGRRSFINANATFLDNAKITIGDNVLIGPNAQFYTPSHSLDYRQRRQWETFSKPIIIENDVWIGGNVVLNQGITIRARSVIAANSVITKDVPSDSLFGGTPAKLIRRLN
ncbi:sugar O-acetyltransferase [Vibrio viridaestus]|uniref:Nodulation protein L n=1 Tax=Vibrio viridaestus TaxID=2487322 RepID=A0A3N9TK36_9VIBR|nr:sugar O-acetyltransferase [Vibrio viridaestus]RQW64637.1 sugar O-acetyltransferase [Vibrio viridaestus]